MRGLDVMSGSARECLRMIAETLAVSCSAQRCLHRDVATRAGPVLHDDGPSQPVPPGLPAGGDEELRALEAQLGVVLVRRTARGAELTKHGHTFLLRARSACREVERGQAELADAVKQASGTIVLGASPAAAAALLPGPLKLLRRDFPVDIPHHRMHAGTRSLV
jgi:hypothetical protein